MLTEHFRHPYFVLFGMFAALAPLIIYLIYRWKMRRVRWGAMTFLPLSMHSPVATATSWTI